MVDISNYIPIEKNADLDWKYLLKRRASLLNVVKTAPPPYLILPEIRALLHHTNDVHLRFFINTLWHTGARISEALALRQSDFYFDDPVSSVVRIETLKKRPGRPVLNKRPGRPKKNNTKRIVPLYSHTYKNELLSYVQSFSIQPDEVIFSKVRWAYNKQLEVLQTRLKEEHNIIFPLKLTPQVFRHSFAINCLLNRIHLSDIQDYLGHANIKETAVYTRIFTGETHIQMAAVVF